MKYEGIVIERPEMHFTPTGQAVANVRVSNDAEQMLIVLWDDLAEKVVQHVRVNDHVEIFGTKKMRWWTDSQGEKHSREEVTAHRLRVVIRPAYPTYCCLSCQHFEADCLTGCYNALGGPSYRELCEVVDSVCTTSDSSNVLINRNCWEKL